MGDTAHITSIITVGVPVTDQARALDFYQGLLGLQTVRDVPAGPAGRWLEVAPAGSATSVALVAAQAGQATGVDTGIRLASADVDADHATLKAAGVDLDDILRFGGPVPPMFVLRDPDGNRLVIVGPMQ